MDLYLQTSYELSERLTLRYSTSFGMSSRLFARHVQPHVYAIYGLVRIADEIVDTYRGENAEVLLDELERHTQQAIDMGYSSNPIVHAFAQTAQRYGITAELTRPFFASMHMDLSPQTYTDQLYRDYIYGSAEVIGLMCLRVFTEGDMTLYQELAPGAQALGAAYQKVNFLRDIDDDYIKLGRIYFPGVEFATFSNEQKRTIEADIEHDFSAGLDAIRNLPRSVRAALLTSYEYYHAVFVKLRGADINKIKMKRMRIPNSYKLILFLRRSIFR